MTVARDEGGAFLVLWTLALVSILMFAALAIDLGSVAQTKQHQQNAADDAAVSAVVDLVGIPNNLAGATNDEEAAVTHVESYAHANNSDITTAEWSSCPNTALPSQVTAWPGDVNVAATNCVGFYNPTCGSTACAANLTQPNVIAVAVPADTVNYTFGKAGGLQNQPVSAVAEAAITNPLASYSLPFAYSVNDPPGLQCLKDSSNPNTSPCGGFTSGSGKYGLIDSPLYVNCFDSCPGTSPSNGGNPVVLADANLGLDHSLIVYNGTAVCDAVQANGCSAYNSNPPYSNADYVNPATGSSLNDLAGALFNADLKAGSFTTPDNKGCTINTPRLSHSSDYDGDGDALTDTDQATDSTPDGFQASDNCSADNPSPSPMTPTLLNTGNDEIGSGDTLNGVQISDYFLSSSNEWANCYQGKGPGGITPVPSSQAVDYVDPASNQNIWQGQQGPPMTEDWCLSNDIQNAAKNLSGGSSVNPMFDNAIVNSPRFGIVPIVDDSQGGNPQKIDGFDGVYLDMDFADKNGQKLYALIAWIFPLALIQNFQLLNQPPGTNNFGGGPYEVQLCSLGAGNC